MNLFFINTGKECDSMAATKQAASYPLRMPEHLKPWVKQRAKKLDRSINWVIVKLIEKAKQEEEGGQ